MLTTQDQSPEASQSVQPAQETGEQQQVVTRLEILGHITVLIGDQLSNPDELRYYLNILYPHLPEFNQPFIPSHQNRLLLIGNLAHAIYMQLAIADPWNPYNDIISLKQVVFNQIPDHLSFLEYNMQLNIQAGQYYAHINYFVEHNRRDLIINRDSVELGLAEIDQIMADIDLNRTDKIYKIMQIGTEILLVKALLLVIEGQLYLPCEKLECDLQHIHQLLDDFHHNANNSAEQAYIIYEEDYNIFIKLAIKLGMLEFIDMTLSLGTRPGMTDVLKQIRAIKLQPLLLMDKPAESIIKEEPRISTTIYAADKEYSKEEVLQKVSPAIENLDGQNLNLLASIYVNLSKFEIYQPIEDGLARIKKENGRFSEKVNKVDQFINVINPCMELWSKCLLNSQIHVRFKKLILKRIMQVSPAEYAETAIDTDYLTIAEGFLSLGDEQELKLYQELQRHDLVSTLNCVDIDFDVIKPDKAGILNYWALSAPGNLQMLQNILDKYCHASNCSIYTKKHNGKTFLQILADSEPETQQSACDLLIKHHAFGQAVCTEALFRAIRTLDKPTIIMLTNIREFKITERILYVAAAIPFCADHQILELISNKYLEQSKAYPCQKSLIDIQTECLDLLARAILIGKNLVNIKYLLSIGCKTNKLYFIIKLNLAQIILIRVSEGVLSCKFACEVLQLICSDPEQRAVMFDARDQDGWRCLEYAAKIKLTQKYTNEAVYLTELIEYLLKYTPDVPAVINAYSNKNIFHIAAEFSYDFALGSIGEHVVDKYGVETLRAVLSQKDSRGFTPVMCGARNINSETVDDKRKIVKFISELVVISSQGVQSAADVFDEWAQKTPTDLMMLDALLLKFFPESAPARSYASVASCIQPLAKTGGSFFHSLALCPMPVIHAALEKNLKNTRVELHVAAFADKDSHGNNLYCKIEKLPDNSAVLRLIQNCIIKLIESFMQEERTGWALMTELAHSFDFFNLQNPKSYIYDLLASKQYTKFIHVHNQHMSFRGELADIVRKTSISKDVARRFKSVILNPIFFSNDLLDGVFAGMEIHVYLQSQTQNGLPELQSIVLSDEYNKALTMRAPTAMREWHDLYKYDPHDDINKVRFEELKARFKKCLIENKLNVATLDYGQQSILCQAITKGYLPLITFTVKECGAIVTNDIIIKSLTTADVLVLEYLAIQYEKTKENTDLLFNDIIRKYRELLFEQIALRKKDLKKFKWLLKNGLDPLALMANGYNMFHSSIIALTSIKESVSFKDAINLITTVFCQVEDRVGLIKAEDHYGSTCLEQIILLEVKQDQVESFISIIKMILVNKPDIDHLTLGEQNIMHRISNAPIFDVAYFVFDFIKQNHSPEKIKQLLDAKAVTGRTPLHLAAVKCFRLFKLFMDNGADPSIKDNNDMNVLEYFKSYYVKSNDQLYLQRDEITQVIRILDEALSVRPRSKPIAKLRA